MKGGRAALALLTRIPMGTLDEIPRYTVAWFWLPGALAGIIWYAAFYLFGSTGVGMIAAVTGEAILTGGVHWKGLAKTFDAWNADRSQRTVVRRAQGIGAAGTVFLMLAALSLWTLWQHGGALVPADWIMPPLWGRAMMAWALTWRRNDASSPFYGKLAAGSHNGAGAWVPLLLALVLGTLDFGFGAVNVFGGSLVLVGFFLWWGSRVFKGMNEDLLFASALLTEVASLYLMVAMTPRIV